MPYAAPNGAGWSRIAGAFTIPNVARPVPGEPAAQRDERFPANWLELSTPEDRAAWNIRSYDEVAAPPAGQRSLGKRLVDVNGSPVEVHDLEAVPLAERKATLLRAIDAERDRRQHLDLVYDFAATEAYDDAGQVITAGPRALQMRASDQLNWMALQSQALVAIISASPETIMPMRAEDNWNVQTAATQVLMVTSAMVQRNAAVLFFGAALKSQVRAAGDSSALDAISITLGWPA